MANNSRWKFSASQNVPLTPVELQELRDAAKASNMTPGLFTRQLVLYGLRNLSDLTLIAALKAARSDAAQRRRAASAAAVRERWDAERQAGGRP